MESVETILPRDATIAFTSRINQHAYAHAWMFREDQRVDDLEHIVFLTETDLSAIGLGAPATRSRADLFCRSDFRPVIYRTESESGVAEAQFNGNIRLRIGESLVVDIAGQPRAVGGDHVGQIALLLRLHHNELGPAWRTSLFSINSGNVFDYSITRIAVEETRTRRFTSTFVEELTLGDDGWLECLVQSNEGAVTVRDTLPRPEWRNARLVRQTPYRTYTRKSDAAFALEDVQIPAPVVSIGATLTLPRDRNPSATVVFLGGSGSHDRHGIAGRIDLGSHEIVDALAEMGWLGIRYDTRGMGTTQLGSDVLNASYNGVLDDARAVLHYIKQRSDVDPKRVVLIGHSQGGLVALELAGGDSDICGVVLLATPGRPADQVLAEQIREESRLLGLDETVTSQRLSEFAQFISLVRSGRSWDSPQIPERFRPARNIRRWYAELLGRDPLQLLSRVTCPVLICQGAKDLQVSAERDATALAETAGQRNLSCRVAIFPDLDHLFMPTSNKPSVADYYRLRHVSREVIQAIAAFLNDLPGRVG